MTVCGEKVTGVCVAGKCPYFKRCHPVVWDKYGKIKPMTNEEWFCGLSTEEKAKVIVNIHNLAKLEQIEWWLKQPHRGVKNGINRC